MIDKEINNQNIKLFDRKILEISGIIKIGTFSSTSFLIDSSLGEIEVKGKDLELVRLDTEDGNVKIRGLVNSINYYDKNIKNKDEGILAKLFK